MLILIKGGLHFLSGRVARAWSMYPACKAWRRKVGDGGGDQGWKNPKTALWLHPGIGSKRHGGGGRGHQWGRVSTKEKW